MTLTPQFIVDGVVKRLHSRSLFCDASHNQGVSGWAVVEGEECIHQDWAKGITSNLAEGMAVLDSIKLVGPDTATIFSDSMAWVSAVGNRKSIRGKGAREVFDEIMDHRHKGISLQWVPSHTGHILGNELADSYAKMARMCRISTTT